MLFMLITYLVMYNTEYLFKQNISWKSIINYNMSSDNTLIDLIRTSVNSGMIYDIASVVHNLLHDVYRVAKLKSKLWYTFDGNRWKPVEAGPYYDLSKIVLKHYESYHQHMIQEKTLLEQNMETPQFELEKKENQERLTQITSECTKVQAIIMKLKNVTFKESLCKECLYMFYDSQFLMNLDKKEHLVCFRNCTYDILRKEVVESTKDNMLSIFIDVDYDPVMFENAADDLEDIINRYIIFRKSILKKRRPTNMYSVKLFQ